MNAFAETISTFAGDDCTTPKADWNLGQTACAGASSPGRRTIVWFAPNGLVAQRSSAFAGTGTDTYTFPTEGPFAQVGTWLVRITNADGDALATASFVVRDATVASADLSITTSGPGEATSGGTISYAVTVFNLGPDDAQNVRFTDSTPANTTFVSATQNSGPGFTCTTTGGVTTCAANTGVPLTSNDRASFTVVYNVNGGTPDGTVIVNTTAAASDTNEPIGQRSDDTTTAQTTITSAATLPCTITCPADISVNNDPQSPNPCAASATYTAPTASGSCADPETGRPADPVTCSPPSGSSFPVGTTAVTCSNGAYTCTFNVVVHETRSFVQPVITCPNDTTVNESPEGSNSATVTFSPAATGNCVTVTCSPASGSVFSVGTTVVSCTATDPAGNSDHCSFNLTVVSTTGPCTLTCSSDVTQTAPSGQCSAAVTYTAPSTSGNCGTVTCDPPSGSTFQSGSTAVTCTSSQGPTCSFAVIVVASAPPTITSCAANRSIATNANCEATIPNMLSEVHTTGCSVTVSQSPSPGTVVNPGTYTVTFTAENSACDPDAVPSTCPSCTATVTVFESTPPVITSGCPAGTSASANSNCQAAVPNVTGGITATDNCTDPGSLVITQSPAAGTLVGKGVTTITVTVKDASNNAATCTTTFTVNDTTPPTISCPASQTVTGQCSAVVTYPAPSAADNCAVSGVSCSPPSGSTFPTGLTTVTCTATDTAGLTASCSFAVTVNPNQVSALSTGKVWVGLKNSDDVGTKFDLLAEILKNGSVVGSGQLNDAPGGSSGFNNAVLDTINLGLSAGGPVNICSGDTLGIRLSVRVATSSGHVSGTARLWFNDSAANSRFTATYAGATTDYYLLSGFALGTAAGPGPKGTIDVLVNRNQGGNPFKPFGTWTKTF